MAKEWRKRQVPDNPSRHLKCRSVVPHQMCPSCLGHSWKLQLSGICEGSNRGIRNLVAAPFLISQATEGVAGLCFRLLRHMEWFGLEVTLMV